MPILYCRNPTRHPVNSIMDALTHHPVNAKMSAMRTQNPTTDTIPRSHLHFLTLYSTPNHS